MRIAVAGTGYVGLVTGTCLADVGNDVVCVDVDDARVRLLNSGAIPFFEPGLGEIVGRNLKDQRLSFTSDTHEPFASAEVCFVAVGTPSDQDGAADLQYVHKAVSNIAQAIRQPTVIAMKSTVPVGTSDRMRRLIADILADRGVNFEFDIVSNPEFLKEGKAVGDFMRPDRIIVGASNNLGIDAMKRVYSAFEQSSPLLFMDVRSAEMTKYVSNIMLAARISLMNEIANICGKVGSDIVQVRTGVGMDQRIGNAFLGAGVGYGGSCFPKDVTALSHVAREHNCPADILEAIDHVNRRQRVIFADHVVARFNGNVRDRRLAVWGLAFKPNTDDVREAPALDIIRRLTEGGARVSAFDPEAQANASRELSGNKRVTFARTAYEALENADALLLITEWAQFRRPDFCRIRTLLSQPIIFDGRNQYDPTEMKSLGFEYYGIGRP
jgi:UDPglucose 6-dehydrogenase